MDNKKIIEKMLEESKERLRLGQESLFRAELMERFARRKSLLVGANTGDQFLAQTQGSVRNIKKAIDLDEDLIKFLEEIKNEK